jgi:hypothetical protein
VQVLTTTTALQGEAKVLRHVPPEHLPVPVGQLDTCLPRRPLDGGLTVRLLRQRQGGGEPPVWAKASAAGPARRKSELPTVCWGTHSESEAEGKTASIVWCERHLWRRLLRATVLLRGAASSKIGEQAGRSNTIR